MPSWNLCNVKCKDGKTNNIKGTEYLFKIVKLVSVQVKNTNQQINNLQVLDNRNAAPIKQPTKTILDERIIGTANGILRNKTNNFERFGANVIGNNITHEVIINRIQNIDSSCVFVIEDTMYNNIRKFKVRSSTIYEKNPNKLIITLEEVSNIDNAR